MCRHLHTGKRSTSTLLCQATIDTVEGFYWSDLEQSHDGVSCMQLTPCTLLGQWWFWYKISTVSMQYDLPRRCVFSDARGRYSMFKGARYVCFDIHPLEVTDSDRSPRYSEHFFRLSSRYISYSPFCVAAGGEWSQHTPCSTPSTTAARSHQLVPSKA